MSMVEESEARAPRRWLGPALLTACGLAAGALAPTAPHLWLLLALTLCLGAPALAAEGSLGSALREAGLGVAGLLLAAGGLAAARFPAGGALLAVAYLAPCALALVGVTRWSQRGGQALASGLGLLVLAAPYLLGATGLDAERSLDLVLHTPLPILTGTCAGDDLLRQGSLYRLLPAAQSLPYAYPSAGAALGSAAGFAALAWLPLGLVRLAGSARGARVPAPLLAGAAALVLLAAPQEASAQGLFPSPSAADPYATGSLETRVRLGYYVGELRGDLRVDPAKTSTGTRRRGNNFDFDRHLDLNQQFLIPTFEVELAWPNAGGLRVQYLEALYEGETQNNLRIFQFEEQRINVRNFLSTRYRFRTIALGGHIDIPIADFITLRAMSTFRYVKNEVKIRVSPQGLSVRNSQEAIVPTIGAGIDVFIWNVISAYADVQWLDFRTSLLGADEGRWRFQYREWRAGVRLELVEHAHVMVEWYTLDLNIRDYEHEEYETFYQGVRVMVAVKF